MAERGQKGVAEEGRKGCVSGAMDVVETGKEEGCQWLRVLLCPSRRSGSEAKIHYAHTHINTVFIDWPSRTWMLQGVREHVRFLLVPHPPLLPFLLVCPEALPGQSPPPVKERASSQVHIRLLQ